MADPSSRQERGFFHAPLPLVLLIILVGTFNAPAHAQGQRPAVALSQQTAALQSITTTTASISGTVIDSTGGAVSGARVTLRHGATPQERARSMPVRVLADINGQYSFSNLAPGPFRVAAVAPGFTRQIFSGILSAGQAFTVPPIILPVAGSNASVIVSAPESEIAEDQLKVEETQRVLGVIPNYYVSYFPDAQPLNTRQKFNLAWKTSIDPVTFAFAGAIAGIEQSQDDYSGYGQGTQGYFKRFGASYADATIDTFIGSAILPAILKQDPRYFYQGTGTVRSRIAHALVSAVMCRGDNKKWQVNYSAIGGSIASAGISNLYYPAQNRDGAQLTFENAVIGIGTSAAGNLFEEFVIRKLTPHVPNYQSLTD